MTVHVVIRYSSLGDIVLAGAVTAALGNVWFLTLPRYHDLARRLDGVVGVLAPGDPLPVGARVIDLQHNLRSLRVPAHARVERQDLRRRARVWWKAPPADPVLTRYGRAAAVTPRPPPWLPPARHGDALVLAPGAAHATKRWPHWKALAAAWPGPVRAVGGPGEQALVGPLGGTCEAGFEHTLAAFEGAAVVCAGDTGLLHLAAAVGLPVVGLFGPTTSTDGFFSYGGHAVELDLACRPCARFGGPVCPVGDHLCLRGLDVATVLRACLAAGRAAA
ncbi:MAG: glycosyltransferase family 9 protein [Myxococcota bacterium]